MKFGKSYYLFIIFVLMINVLLVHAQSTDDSENADETEIAANPNFIRIPFDRNIMLQGLNASGDNWFALPNNWQLSEQDIEVILSYRASEELLESQSSLTIFAGDSVPVKSINIIADGQSHTTSFTFPSTLAYTTGIFLQYKAHLQTTEGACESNSLPSQWLVIGDDSTIGLVPDNDPAPPTLDQLYSGLIPNSPFIQNKQVIVVLPDSPTSVELTTAVSFSRWLGTQYDGYPRPFLLRYESELTELERSTSNLVIIGQPENNSLIPEIIPQITYEAYRDGQFLSLDGIAIPELDAIFHFVQSPWNPEKSVLLISGNSAAGLQNGGKVLSNPSLLNAFRESSNFINIAPLDIQIADDMPLNSSDMNDFITFEELGEDAIWARSIGSTTKSISLIRPPGWILEEGSEIVLRIGTSSLDAGSFIAVFLDGIFLGSIDTDNQRQIEASLSIPVEDINKIWEANPSSIATLEMEITNLFQTHPCQANAEETVWTRIENTSFVKYPHTYVQLPNIPSFPYPFIEEELSTTFILPQAPTSSEVEIAMQLASEIGEFAERGVDLAVITTEMYPDTMIQNAIVIGDIDRQPIINMVLQDAQDLPRPNVYTRLNNPNLSIIREVIAPWNINSTVMLIYGNNPTALIKAVESLNNRNIPENTYIQEDDGIRIIELSQTTSTEINP